MKTIGLIGGTGWVSTVEYYRIINETVKEKLGGFHSAKCLLHSVNFHELNELKKIDDNEESVFGFFKEISMTLCKAGADCIMLCANTAHVHAERLEKEIPVPLIHIAEATAKRIQNANLAKVGLLGTIQTMELDFYKKKLIAEDIEVIIPGKEDRNFVNTAIWDELLMGIILAKTKAAFLQIIEKMVLNGAEGIILGCTEIPLIIDQTDISLPLFNTLEIHSKAAVDFAL